MWWLGQLVPLVGIALRAAGMLREVSPRATCHRGIALPSSGAGFAALWEAVSSVLAAAAGVSSSWDGPGGKLRQGTEVTPSPVSPPTGRQSWALGRCRPDDFAQERSREQSHTARQGHPFPQQGHGTSLCRVPKTKSVYYQTGKY